VRGQAALAGVMVLLLSGMTASAQDNAAASWSGSTTLMTYAIPGEENYAQPTVTADREWLHVQARYNYEERDTGSLWFGYNLAGGDAVAWTFTPMLGGAFGHVTGVAPGYSASLTWWKVDVYGEGEYLSDLAEPSDSFLYNWSEVSLRPLAWWRVGLVTQRTRARDEARDIQRGPLVGLTIRSLDLAVYMLDDGDSAPTIAMSVGWTLGSD
jgi:hypothetical protein